MPIVLSDPSKLSGLTGSSSAVVTIGNFDGVHTGHRTLLQHTAEKARELALPAVAITFDPHPEALFSSAPPRALCTIEQKIELLGQNGMDAVLLLPFTRQLASQSAASFCRSVLIDALHAAELFVGYDFRMGSDQTSDLDPFCSYHLHRVPAVFYGGLPVSSTRIRTALAENRLEEANAMLGRPFAVRGTVVHGAGRGGPLLGIPTANLGLAANQITPQPAAYATSARIGSGGIFGEWKKAVTSFCKNPTFQGTTLTMETHLLDFADDIYGKSLEVRFLSVLRQERRFDSLEALKAQLQADTERRRSLPL